MRLGRLFGKKAELEVTTDGAAYLPGDEVQATIRITGKKNFEIEEARAELVYENEYTYRTRSYSGTTKRWETEDETTTEKVVHAEQRFLERGTIARGATSEHAVSLRIPTDAIGSGEGEITKVRWRAEATLAIGRGLDPDANAPITVLSPREVHSAWARRAPELDEPDECELELRLPAGRHLRTGDTIDGTLVATPRSALDAQEVRVELVRHEEVPRDQGKEEDVVAAKAVLSEQTELSTGIPREYPFQLPVPEGAIPCLDTGNSTVRWRLRGVVARRLRSDYNVTLELNVYSAPSVGPPPEEPDVWSEDGLEIFKRAPGAGEGNP